ncbi:DNA-binding transcriptional regulator, XRE-family HTH domain [Ruminococcus sp. YE71]|uniref:helix-turn-helix domain-containing protein n=1 Tax=unclassified Ruminococcus TaxID=2608920 RepID=UPI000885460C|nr:MULTISPECIES: helix-turn-helix transcriptional regulator [unclassified Ruminococcus]SDA14026.1 DNA-binding transcriptional regulator, XRE-family HTH domain [Ruminococcus sp. YE78]SFW20365.1 DNA-binding transcriptional regulator, XRE-family HTH domain [Ruminococcus sp. YE71]
MELGTQIKRLRKERGWNQEEFAEKAYVSRQTVSNWENEKSYPDVHSLLILSDLFGVSLDELVKGDVEEMKKEIRQESIAEYNRWANIYSVMFIIAILLPYPLAKFLGWVGAGIWLVYMGVTMCVAIKCESLKKQNNIQTFKEIVAFTEGRTLDEIEQIREQAKRPYQKILLAIAAAVAALLIMLLMHLILG